MIRRTGRACYLCRRFNAPGAGDVRPPPGHGHDLLTIPNCCNRCATTCADSASRSCPRQQPPRCVRAFARWHRHGGAAFERRVPLAQRVRGASAPRGRATSCWRLPPSWLGNGSGPAVAARCDIGNGGSDGNVGSRPPVACPPATPSRARSPRIATTLSCVHSAAACSAHRRSRLRRPRVSRSWARPFVIVHGVSLIGSQQSLRGAIGRSGRVVELVSWCPHGHVPDTLRITHRSRASARPCAPRRSGAATGPGRRAWSGDGRSRRRAPGCGRCPGPSL